MGSGVNGGADDSERKSFGGRGGGTSIGRALVSRGVTGEGVFTDVSVGGAIGRVCGNGVSMLFPFDANPEVSIVSDVFFSLSAKLSLNPVASSSLSLSSAPRS